MPEDEEPAAPKRKFPYLKAGQNKQRSYLRGNPTPSVDPCIEHSPHPSLSPFLPSTSAFSNPPTGRSTDSGVPHEDVTRPPTGASLPMDRPSSHETRQPIVEEHEDEGNGDEISEEAEQISARVEPTFQPDSGASSYMDPITEPSEHAVRMRNQGNAYVQHGQKIHTMGSVSISPSTYGSSEISGPIGASTPIFAQQAPPSSFHPIPSHHETPPARPLTSHRMNMQQNAAQTGISLVMPRAQQPRHQLRHRQKENIPEHVYDQPIHMTPAAAQPPTTANNAAYQRVIRNLTIQLRDAIAHVDFADEQVRKSTRELVEKYKEHLKKNEEAIEKEKKELKEEYEELKKRLEEEFESKCETIKENQRKEEERNARDRREIERERKLLQKGDGEKDKEMGELRKKLENSETQNAKLRLDVRARDEKLKKKTEELEKITKELERSKKNCTAQEKRLRQMKAEMEKEAKEAQMFVQAAQNRTKSFMNKTELPIPNTVRNTAERRAPEPARARSVSWAEPPAKEPEVPEEFSLSEEGQMHLAEQTRCALGMISVYRDGEGEVTKVTPTIEDGRLFEFSNGDRRFVTAQQVFAWYQHVADGCIEMDIASAGIKFIMHLNRQLEIYRPGDNTTLISANLLEIRTELIRHRNGTICVEIFNRDGTVRTKTPRGPDTLRKYTAAEKTTFRQTRHVVITEFDDFELVEPEFRLRWYKGKTVVIKVFGREGTNEKTLRFEMNPRTGDGMCESVESQLEGGVARKTSIFNWQGPQ